MASSCSRRKVAAITLWVTIPLLILSIVMIFVFDVIYDKTLKKEITLSENSLVTEIWKDIPLPIYERIYFFNITNEDGFLSGEKLKVVEVGPYTYKARWAKPHLQWHPNNTVSYQEVRTYEFIPELSSGTEDDSIYTLNAPLIIASHFAKDWIYFAKFALYLFLLTHEETLVTQKTVRQLVYEGYDDAIIKDATYVKDLPYKEGRFAWLWGKNATDDGLFTVFTGEDDASKTNFINRYNGREKLSFWKEDSCNAFNGSTSIETGPPIESDIDSYTFFQTIFCRSLTFDYALDTSHRGIPAKRFKPSHLVFANSTVNPENACYEVHQQHASGILDVSPCQFGAPAFLSFPHFHMADPSYLEIADGLSPNESLHGSNIDVEPITGMSIDISMKFQINVEIAHDPVIRQFHQTREGIYPVFWVDLSLNIDEKMASFLKRHVNLPKIIAYVVIITVSVVSLIAIVVSCVVLAFTRKQKVYRSLSGANSSQVEKRYYSIGKKDTTFEDHTIIKVPGDGKRDVQPGMSHSINASVPETANEKSAKTAENIYPSL